MTEEGIEIYVKDSHDKNANSQIIFNEDGDKKVTFCNFERQQKAFYFILITEEGIVISVINSYKRVIFVPIEVIDEGIEKDIFSSDVQLWNIYDGNFSTKEGIVILFNDEQQLKANFPIFCKEDGSSILFNEQHSLNLNNQ